MAVRWRPASGSAKGCSTASADYEAAGVNHFPFAGGAFVALVLNAERNSQCRFSP
jgi:hypothetical protein